MAFALRLALPVVLAMAHATVWIVVDAAAEVPHCGRTATLGGGEGLLLQDVEVVDSVDGAEKFEGKVVVLRFAVPAIEGLAVEFFCELLDDLGPVVGRNPHHGDDAVIVHAIAPTTVRHRSVSVAQVLGGPHCEAGLVPGPLQVFLVVEQVVRVAVV